jgi:hypothetical protein
MSDTIRVFWKCQTKGCKVTRVTDLPTGHDGRPKVPGVGHIQHHIGGWAFNTADIRAAWGTAGLVCADHNQLMRGEALRGTYNPDKACDGRCMSARRASCDCSCGGENHGASAL